MTHHFCGSFLVVDFFQHLSANIAVFTFFIQKYQFCTRKIMVFAFEEVTFLTPWALRGRKCSSCLSQTDDFHATLHETYMGSEIATQYGPMWTPQYERFMKDI